MGNILNQDFTDFIVSLKQAEVKYILVGGYAVIFHGYNRTTGDLDIWVEATPANYIRIKKAFAIVGLSLFNMTKEKFCNPQQMDVFTFGRPPVCIEILSKVSGLEFQFAYQCRLVKHIGLEFFQLR